MVSATSTASWVNDIFKWSLHEAESDPPECFVRDNEKQTASPDLAHISALLLYLSTNSFSRTNLDKAKRRWVSLATSISWLIESRRCRGGANQELPALRAKSRQRRVPQDLKRQLVDAAASGNEKCTPQQLLRASRFWRPNGSAEEGADMSTKQWAWSVMYEYTRTGREVLNDKSDICLALDGVRVSLLMVVDAPSSQRCCWLPVQALKWVPHSIKPNSARTRNIIRSFFVCVFHTEHRCFVRSFLCFEVYRAKHMFLPKFVLRSFFLCTEFVFRTTEAFLGNTEFVLRTTQPDTFGRAEFGFAPLF